MLFLETPVPAADLDEPWVVTPGIEGFLMFLVLALAAWFLISSMLNHVRKANFRAAEREEELYGSAPAAEVTVPDAAPDAGTRDTGVRDAGADGLPGAPTRPPG